MLQKFFKYIFQSMAGMLGISVYILADTYFISVYSGADGLAVLNLILPVYGLIYAIGAMIGIGSATRYAIDRARGKSASFYFLSAVTWDILISIPLMLAGIFIPDKILQLLGADAGLTALGKQYLRIILAASPFFMSNYAFTAFARNDSAPAIAMLGSIAGSMFNIVFDYVFMFPAGLGLTGAALATAFCPLVTMIICSTHYLGKHNQVGFHFRAPSLLHLIACCQLGVSAFVGEISSAVIAIVFNFLLLGLAGNVGVAAYGVTANLSVVAMCLFNGLAQGTQPLISESYGKGDHTQSRQFLTWGVIACLIVEALILVLTWSMTDPLIQIFNQEQNAELLHYAHSGLRLYFLGFLFAGINILLVAYFSASGETARLAKTIADVTGGDLFEILPEAGDLDKPRMVFFFDEAHMLFRDAPTVLLQKVEQTVKLIRSRGVGVYFVTQSPGDIPDTVLAQLSNRVQHALRAYTPTELKAVRAAARAFRPNPAFQAEDAIMELGVGEALTSFLDEAGVPAMVERTKIICPQSLMSVPEPMVRAKVMMHDGMEKYDEFVDNVSAYEVLTAEREEAEAAKQEEADRKAREKEEAQAEKLRLKEEEAERKRKQKLEDEARRKAERRAAKIESQLISAGGQVLKRGLLGVLKKW